MTPEQALAKASELRTEAQQHKRLQHWHRRRVRDAMSRLAELEATCDRLGIRLHLHPPSPDQGRPSGNQHPQQDEQEARA